MSAIMSWVDLARMMNIRLTTGSGGAFSPADLLELCRPDSLPVSVGVFKFFRRCDRLARSLDTGASMAISRDLFSASDYFGQCPCKYCVEFVQNIPYVQISHSCLPPPCFARIPLRRYAHASSGLRRTRDGWLQFGLSSSAPNS